MPKTTKSGKAKQEELPSTLQRSGKKAQQTFAKTYESAIEQYDDEQRAHQVAFASLKHTHEKVGDHWEERRSTGPPTSRPKAARTPTCRPPAESTPMPPRSTSMSWPPGWRSTAGPP